MTEREVERRGYILERDGVRSVTQSARWLGESRNLVSITVSSLALAVIQLARSTMPAEQFSLCRQLLNPLMAVARAAKAPTGYRDPDPSSWPAAFAAFAASCMITLAELQSSRRGEGVVPLLDTDELYEAWLAVQIRAVLNERFDTWRLPDSDAFAAWDQDDTVYEIWLKPGIGRDGRVFGSESFRTVIAELLTPDLVLSATRGDETELMALDAKAWAQMLPEDALSQSAKYLYGIRRAREASVVPALTGVDLVTCARSPSITAGDLAKVVVSSATPTAGVDALHARIGDLLDQLAAALVERERLASAY